METVEGCAPPAPTVLILHEFLKGLLQAYIDNLKMTTIITSAASEILLEKCSTHTFFFGNQAVRNVFFMTTGM